MFKTRLINSTFSTPEGKSISVDEITVILDSNRNIVLLPLLFSIYMARTGLTIQWKRLSKAHDRSPFFQMNTQPVGNKTIRAYISQLLMFLRYLEVNEQTIKCPGVHESFKCNTQLVNTYLNQELIVRVKSEATLQVAKSALTAYFNFLEYIEIRPRLDLKILRQTLQQVAKNDDRPRKISYVSREQRTLLLRACRSKSERLILRMGYEVGLRAAENRGLLVNGKNNVIELFSKLKTEKLLQTNNFAYWLTGSYTKGGKSRWVYFNRSLVIDMLDYFETERDDCLRRSSQGGCNSFFVTSDPGGTGRPISARHASNIFTKRKKNIPYMQKTLSYHDLRHTFATELYHKEITSGSGRETRSESAALLVTSERLGHQIGRDGYASGTTKRYIRLRETMLDAEEIPDY